MVTLGCVAVGAVVIAAVGGGVATRSAHATSLLANLSPIQQRLLSGFASTELGSARGGPAAPQQAGKLTTKPAQPTASGPGCPTDYGTNIRVNQNCLNISDADLQGRGQAENETAIASDPNDRAHLVASYNDYRRGDATCGVSYSLNGGDSWIDATLPDGFTRGAAFGGVARQYWQAGGDTSVGWDTKGNAYLLCQVFMRGAGVTNNPDLSSAFYLYRSTGSNGASWNFTGRPVAELNDVSGDGSRPDAPEQEGGLLDKEYLAVDNHAGSPYQDRIYATWTLFADDGTAYIYEAHSDDYGETFSAPVVASTTSSLCANTFGVPTPNGTCNENQDSEPFTGPDGALYVVFNNYNNALSGSRDNHNQVLLTRSTDGGNTFSAPVLVGNFYDLPDCATYQGGQDPGRACVPEKGPSTTSIFRANNYPSGAVNPRNPSQVAVTFGSYINSHSNESNGCRPRGFAADGQNLFRGVKAVGACNNDILVSVSSDGGSSFTGTTTDPRSLTSVNQDADQATTDQFWQWAAFDGNQLAVSYYDRQYENDETTGYLDFSLSGSADLAAFATTRATTASMPPPTQFPNGNGNGQFLGDYTGLATGRESHPIWADTRTVDEFLCPGTGAPGVPPALCTAFEPSGLHANDEDVYTAHLSTP